MDHSFDIAFDIDGPLFQDRTKGFFAFMQARGIRCCYLTYAQTGDWDLASPGMTHPERTLLYQEFIASHNGAWRDEPTRGARRALRSLRFCQRHVVTTRGKQVETVTRQALYAHFGPFAGYHFGIAGKAPKLQELSAHIFVEDNPREALQAANAGIRVILFPARGVRRRLDHPGVITLSAESMAESEMADDRWHQLTCQAWQEITQIVLSAMQASACLA